MAKNSKNTGRQTSFKGAKRTNIIISAVVAVGVAITGYSLLIGSAAAPTASVTTTTTPAGTANFEVGFDHTQTSHLASDAGGNTTAVRAAKTLLGQLNAPQNVHIMGFGAGNPEPSKGKYDWGSLDSRVRVMGDTVGESQRMITLCTAPGWMKGTDDWNMDAAVQSSHFGDFATLSAAVAQRYDGTHKDAGGNTLPKVVYFDVWNEMKGFWNNSKNRWDYEGYTNMYNQVYTAIKKVRPDAKIGGPYPSFGPSQYNPSGVKGAYGTIDQRTLDVMTYWLKNKKGAEFISLDGGPQTDFEKGTVATDGFTSGAMFADLAKWIRSLNDTTYPGAKTLPIRWVEFYPGIGSATGQKAVAISLDNALTAGLAGVSSVYVWEPEGDASGNSQYTGKAVWTDTSKSGGGQSTAFYSALKTLHDTLPVGAQLYQTTVSGPITAFATKDKVLLISKSAVTLNVSVNGTTVSLSPYAVTAVASTPSTGGGSTPTPPPTSSNAGAFVGIAGKCLDNSGSKKANGNKIQLYTCNGTGAQKWTINSNGTITNSNGYCLDATDAGTVKGTIVQLWQCDDTKAQQWSYDKTASVIHYANPNASNLCLDAKNAGTTNGTQIQIYTCNGTAAQKWTLTAQ
jgi:hypothetical protein